MLDAVAADLSNRNPDIESLSPRQRASHIASFLRLNNFTGIASGREYHSLEHNFLGFALKDQEHNSLPLISASIFCYIARHFGLNAHPCGFPFHVLVIIFPSPGLDMDGFSLNGDSVGVPMYMDPFRSGEETCVADLQSQLNLLGASPTEQSTFLGESQTSEIVLRCGRNVMNSVRVILGSEFSNVDIESAGYAGLWSFMLVNPYGRLMEIRRHLPWFMDVFASEFPWDIYLVEKHVLPLFEGLLELRHLMESLHAIRAADETPRSVRRRKDVQKTIKYQVGEVFRHRRYNYTAMIIGWDPECGAGEHWMRRMNVDQLQAGRHQSFYHVQ
jgi:F-box protein 21